ncbi:protein G12-like [Anopheles bellator]|uniref:protein G12-like n=1 Tax=Anopheles bellator TaxID=139047 RepID=UPI0026471F34|nr:protein G12-like [Anopheles bellator]
MLQLVGFLVIIVTVNGVPVDTDLTSLLNDYNQFVDVLPIDRLFRLTNDYYNADTDFKTFLTYLEGREFSVVWNGILALPAVDDFTKYLANANVPVYDVINIVAAFIGQPSVYLRTAQAFKASRQGGLKGFVKELFSVLPVAQWQQLYAEKMKNSPAFKEFINKLRGFDYVQIKNFYSSSREFRSFVKMFRDYGIDVGSWQNAVKKILGWGNIFEFL